MLCKIQYITIHFMYKPCPWYT
uniref:Uncharacterized protein n=1 Tax=Arundo donax TaxID=35708 RepID=A0A0A9SVH4_ARUDO